MIKKELGVYRRVPGNDQQKTIWISPYPAQGTKDKTLLNGPFKMGRKNCYGVGFGIKSFMKGI